MNVRALHNKVSTGFSLIELMVVIAVVAVLAVIAIPAYKNYTVKAKLTEAMNYMKIAKTEIEERYVVTGSYCLGTTEEYYTRDTTTTRSHRFRCNQPPNSSVYALQYIFNGSFDSSIPDNAAIQMKPNYTDNGIDWVCTTVSFPADLSPC